MVYEWPLFLILNNVLVTSLELVQWQWYFYFTFNFIVLSHCRKLWTVIYNFEPFSEGLKNVRTLFDQKKLTKLCWINSSHIVLYEYQIEFCKDLKNDPRQVTLIFQNLIHFNRTSCDKSIIFQRNAIFRQNKDVSYVHRSWHLQILASWKDLTPFLCPYIVFMLNM